MMDILTSFVSQIIGTIGVIYIGGLILSVLNRWFYSNLGVLGSPICYLTGFIGTPIHEISHVAFCVLFGHKINEIKLFQIDPKTGTLGYVYHSYNSKNIYQLAGNFFIGVAPILVMSSILYGLSLLLMGDVIKPFIEMFDGAKNLDWTSMSIQGLINAWGIIKSGVKTWNFWVFMIVGIIFSLHMTLSTADIKNSLSGLMIVIGIIFFSDLVVGLVNKNALISVNEAYMKISTCLTLFLSISIIISFILTVITFVVGKLFLIKRIPLFR